MAVRLLVGVPAAIMAVKRSCELHVAARGPVPGTRRLALVTAGVSACPLHAVSVVTACAVLVPGVCLCLAAHAARLTPFFLGSSVRYGRVYIWGLLCLALSSSRVVFSTVQAVVMQSAEFQHILRILNTNIEGRHKTMFALTAIKGVGRRFSNLVLKKADVDLTKRAGMLTSEEIDRIVTIIQNPRQFKIPDWFLNRQKDFKDGKYSQLIANNLDFKMREDLDRMRKIRCHRGLRHYAGLRVRGQHTKTTGRRGRTVGVSKRRNP